MLIAGRDVFDKMSRDLPVSNPQVRGGRQYLRADAYANEKKQFTTISAGRDVFEVNDVGYVSGYPVLGQFHRSRVRLDRIHTLDGHLPIVHVLVGQFEAHDVAVQIDVRHRRGFHGRRHGRKVYVRVSEFCVRAVRFYFPLKYKRRLFNRLKLYGIRYQLYFLSEYADCTPSVPVIIGFNY